MQNPRYVKALAQRKAHAQLSDVCSALLKEFNAMQWAHEEVDAYFAPSECHSDVNRGYLTSIDVVLKQHGWSAAVLAAVLEQRTSSKWLYCCTPLGMILGEAESREQERYDNHHSMRARVRAIERARAGGRKTNPLWPFPSWY